jgi:transposase
LECNNKWIIEPECSDVCIEFGVSRETWYKSKRRYDAYGIDGLKDQSGKPRNIKNVKVTEELEKLVLELRLNNRFGPKRISFRLKSKYGVSLKVTKKHVVYVQEYRYPFPNIMPLL